MFTTSCHCGAIQIELQRKARQLTQCNCSICRRYGAIWAYFQRKSIAVTGEPEALESYAHGKRKLTFIRCATCGCVTHYERIAKHADGSDMAGINMRNIDDPSIVRDLPVRLLDGAATWKVLERRKLPFVFGCPDER